MFGAPPVVEATVTGPSISRKEEATRQGVVWPLVTRQVSAGSSRPCSLRGRRCRRSWRRRRTIEPRPACRTPPPPPSSSTPAVALDQHQAYALGSAGDESGARGRLQDSRGVRRPLGPRLRRPDRAGGDADRACGCWPRPVTGRLALEGRLATWPAEARVRLADVGSCRVVRDPAAVRALTTQPRHLLRRRGSDLRRRRRGAAARRLLQRRQPTPRLVVADPGALPGR